MRKIPKIIAYILLGIIGLIILIFIILQIPATQEFIARKVSETFSKNLQTHVFTDKIRITPFGGIRIDNLLIIDLENDTLLRADRVSGNIHYWKMLSSEIYLTNLKLYDAVANIEREKGEEDFNYQFLIDYFVPPSDTTTTGKTWYFDIGSVKVDNLNFNFKDAVTGMVIYANPGQTYIDFTTLGLEEAFMEIDEVNIQNGRFRIVQYEPSPLDVADTVNNEDEPKEEVDPQRYSINYLGFKNVSFQYDDMQVNPIPKGVDFSHLDIQKLNADIENININGTNVTADIQNIALREKSGLHINRFTTNLVVTDKEIALRDLLLKTPGTTLREYFAMKYDSFEEFNTFAEDVIMHARFVESKLQMKDVMLFVPGLDTLSYFKEHDINEIFLEGNFDGKLVKFVAEDLAIKINDQNLIKGNVTANNLLTPDKIFLSVDIDRLLLNPELIQPFVSSPAIPNEVWNFNQIKFEGQFILLPNSLKAQNATLALDNNLLELSGTIANFENIENATFNVNVEQLVAHQQAINLIKAFGVELPGDLGNISQAVVSGEIRGTADNLFVNDLAVSLDNRHVFKGSAHLKNIDNINNAFIDANIATLRTNSEMIASFIPNESLPENFHELGQVSYSGRIYGTSRDLTTQGTLTSDVGTLKPNLNINIPEEKYKGTISTQNFDLGFLTSDSLGLGRATFTANVQGQGFDLENIEATGALNVKSIEYNNYTYQNIKVDGTFNDQVISGDITINDPNLQLDFNGTISLKESAPVFNFNAQLAEANFQNLNLTSEPYQLSANFNFNFTGSTMDDLTGKGVISNFRLEDGQTIYTDSIVISSTIQNDTQTIAINSDILDFSMVGDYNIAKVPVAVTEVVNSYLYADPVTLPEAEPQYFTYRLIVKRSTPIPALFIPGFEVLGAGRISGLFNSEERNLTAEGGFNVIKFETVEIENPGIEAGTVNNSINYNFTSSAVTFMDSILLPNARINGSVTEQNVQFEARVFSDTAVDRLHIAGALDLSGEYQRLTLDPSTVVFNNEEWSIPAGNEILFGDQYFKANNFILQNGQQRIALNPGTNVNDLILSLQNVNLHSFANVAVFYGFDFGGIANGEVAINNIFGNQGIDVDAAISNFYINQDTIGDVIVQYEKAINSTIANVELAIQQPGANSKINGTINTTETATNLNLIADLNQFELVILEPFLVDIVSNLSGTVSGDLAIGGTLESPGVNGSIALNNASITPVLNQTAYQIQNTTINLNNSVINLSNLVLVDPKSNKLFVDGVIRHNNFEKFVLDLTATTTKFQFLNTTARDNEFFYGTVFASGTITITGDITDPDIYVDATTAEGTSVFLPTVQSNSVSSYDFIQFRPIEEEEEMEIKGPNVGFDVEMNLEVESNAKVTIVINPLTGEQLVSRGHGSLYLTTNELGDMDIYGTFIVDEGEYTFALEREGLTRKRLSITEGSTLSWRGDPTEAIINATAVYDVTASVQPLVPGAQDAAYRKRVPIDVIVDLRGELFAPEIAFDLQLDQENVEVLNNNVAQVIQQLKADQNELNKQVFGLLIFDQFLPASLSDINLGGEGDGTFLYNTIGGFVSNQLSKLVSNKLGVDMDVTFEQYDVTGADNSIATTSSVNVALSKAFLNDRLEVIIGSSYYTGDEPMQGQEANFLGFGDIIIRYDVTPNGNLKVKLFNKNDFDIFREEIQNKMGGGMSYSIEFDKLFGRKEDEVSPTPQEIKQLEREQQQNEILFRK